MPTRRLQTTVLDLAHEVAGPADGEPVVLVHGFPDDAHAWDDVAALLAAEGRRALAPHLRGFGPTRFLHEDTPRSAQLAALAQDLLDFVDALGLERFTLVGADWGARAAQAVAVLVPQRVTRLVTVGGYAVTFDQAGPISYPQLKALWYQWVLLGDLGPYLVQADRREFCRYLWQTWSPTWKGVDAAFEATADALENPDFAAIALHGYRHGRSDDAPGDPAYDDLEQRLAQGPPVPVPTVVLFGEDDGIDLLTPASTQEAERFPGGYRAQVVPGAGHFLHRERPDVVAEAVLGA